MAAHHKNGPWCELCEDKLLTLDPELQPAARHFKEAFPEGHLSWGYRNEEDQNRAFAEGKTRAKFPHSKHNRMRQDPATGVWEPAARAFDFFRIRPDGVAEWKVSFCQTVWKELEGKFPGKLEWAGNWPPPNIKEYDHIQLKG